MHEILSSSSAVSPTNVFGVREGLGLPEVRRLIDYRQDWNDAYEYPWAEIRRIWLMYWDTSKPWLMDKSPPNILRAPAIARCFDPASFVVMTRNPFAHAEGMMRRNGLSLNASAKFVVSCLVAQRNNVELRRPVCVVRYEDLVKNSVEIRRKLSDFLPGVGDISIDGDFSAHNHRSRRLPIRDFNNESLARLSSEQVAALRDHFAASAEVLSFFGYALG